MTNTQCSRLVPSGIGMAGGIMYRGFLGGRLDVSDPTARSAIAALEAVGLLEEFTGRSWGKVWVARPVLEVLERPL